MKPINSGRFLAGCGSIIALCMCASSRGDYLTVIGGPSYTPSNGGYQNPSIPGPASVNDSGVAIANVDKYNKGGVRISSGAIRFDAQGNFSELNSFTPDANGIQSGQVSGINNAGAAAGFVLQNYKTTDVQDGVVARWDAGSNTAVQLSASGSNPGGTLAEFGINSSGTVYGVVSFKGVVFPAGGGSAALVSPVSSDTEPTAINDQGTLVGTPNGGSAVQWDPGQTQGVSIGEGVNPTAINNSGMIIGDNANGTQSFRWMPNATTPQSLAKLTASDSGNHAAGLNDSGIIVGTSGNSAVYWAPTNNIATGLGNLAPYQFARPADINNSDSIVGDLEQIAPGGGLIFAAAYWESLTSEPIDLNSLIDPQSGWTLNHARNISDTGWILGTGTFDPDGPGGQAAYTRLFLLHVPEPALTLNLFAILGFLRPGPDSSGSSGVQIICHS